MPPCLPHTASFGRPSNMIDIVYADEDIVVCVKPARVLSTDEPGGLPELLRQQLGT